jgi:superfamily II DNA or RNA helicase
MTLPDLWTDEYRVEENTARQLLIRSTDDVNIVTENGKLYARAYDKKWQLLQPNEDHDGDEVCLRLAQDGTSMPAVSLENAAWVGDKELTSANDVLAGVKNKFHLLEEKDGSPGLRTPQVGAIHSVLGLLTLKSPKPATVVLPTGTGKTETMLSIHAKGGVAKLLVIVPTVALRNQISKKFEYYGVLKQLGVLDEASPYPVVGRIEHGFTTKLGARGFVDACNVIVATPDALNSSPDDIRNTLLKDCTHLFVDEAHHITAATWNQIKNEFNNKPVIQFTATPYRNDGEKLGGKIIYNFPLRQAQESGYFSKINYIGVVDFNDADKALADKAVEQLRSDLSKGLDHVLMARVKSVARAQEVVDIYKQIATDLEPTAMYNSLKEEEKKQAFEDLESRKCRIIVCVNMLGEGYDMPSLKVAAVHDPHHSLGVTLQFIGRFARVSGATIGDATFIVNRGDPQHDKRLKELYQQDNDWNYIVRELSAAAVEEEEDSDEFKEGFNSLPEELSLKNIAPKMSTVVYATNQSSWHPERLEEHFGEKLFTNPVPVNHAERVAWLVTKRISPVRWGDLHRFDEVNYDLYVFYWDSTNKRLYINSSSNDGVYKDIAKLLCGDDVELFRSETTFRPIATLKRRVATTVGVLDTRNRDTSYQMNSGSNVEFTPAATRNKTQTNMFAHGYDERTADRITIGASRRGRIWSSKSSVDLKDWMNWCDYIGKKVADTSISLDDITQGFMKPEPISSRPNIIPLLLEWPAETYMNVSEEILVELNGEACPLLDTELVISEFKNSGPIPFVLRAPTWEAKFTVELANDEMKFSSVGDVAVYKNRSGSIPFTEYLDRMGLKIICESQVVITSDMHMFTPNATTPAYDSRKLETLDWAGIDIQRESQGAERDATTVQARAVQYVESLDEWDVILDDDGPGEAADIVALKINGNRLIGNLIHCKYSGATTAGHRISDLYELCGQAIKSVDKVRNPDLLIKNLIRREKNRRPEQNNLLKGDDHALQKILEEHHILIPSFTITIVQPGVKKPEASSDQLELLAATESYISDTGAGTPLKVIVNS